MVISQRPHSQPQWASNFSASCVPTGSFSWPYVPAVQIAHGHEPCGREPMWLMSAGDAESGFGKYGLDLDQTL